MGKTVFLVALLLASGAASTASANWFSNTFININLNLGSAPNPTPSDILGARVPLLVRDADGNIIAMIDAGSGEIIATAEPQPPPKSAKVAPRSNPMTSAH
jgi:hypothetical protein